ncbi:MAG: hypothetical protein LBW85_07580 [Deltaproteobacteria bacterium]|nr:hypothetical protein [Deltaproteobacteria bacterium]
MTGKTAARLLVGPLMAALLLFQMGYQFWEGPIHEWAGALLAALFAAHHLLNAGWHASLFTGKYPPWRVYRLCVSLALLAAAISVLWAALVLSAHLPAFLRLEGDLSFARRLHMLGVHWAFILAGMHVGLNLGRAARASGSLFRPGGGAAGRLLSAAGLLAAAWGAWAFFRRGFPGLLFSRQEFAFLDYGEPQVRFYLDYLAIAFMCAFASRHFAALLRRRASKAGTGPRPT